MPKVSEALLGNRLVELQFEEMQDNSSVDNAILDHLIEYLNQFSEYHNLSADDVFKKHFEFLSGYNSDVKEFLKTDRYPYEYGEPRSIGRLDYDVPLICSSFLSLPRYQIFDKLRKYCQHWSDKNILIVGAGAGIELSFIDTAKNRVHAYDSLISDFVKSAFEKVEFHQKHFKAGVQDCMFDHILLIELLEHIPEPLLLLQDAMQSVSDDGSIHFTTAVNIPQFDHVYKFAVDDRELVDFIAQSGFRIVSKSNFKHSLLKSDTGSYSCYYIIEKTH